MDGHWGGGGGGGGLLEIRGEGRWGRGEGGGPRTAAGATLFI